MDVKKIAYAYMWLKFTKWFNGLRMIWQVTITLSILILLLFCINLYLPESTILDNLSSGTLVEIIGIVITLWFVDRIYQRRQAEKEKGLKSQLNVVLKAISQRIGAPFHHLIDIANDSVSSKAFPGGYTFEDIEEKNIKKGLMNFHEKIRAGDKVIVKSTCEYFNKLLDQIQDVFIYYNAILDEKVIEILNEIRQSIRSVLGFYIKMKDDVEKTEVGVNIVVGNVPMIVLATAHYYKLLQSLIKLEKLLDKQQNN